MPSPVNFREANAKFRMGDSISDAELTLLRKHYRAAATALRECYSQAYSLVLVDLNNKADALDGYHKARKESRERKRTKRVASY